MLNKTAMIIGLALVAGTGLTAENTMSHEQMSGDSMGHDKMGHDAMGSDKMGHDGMAHDAMAVGDPMSMRAPFDALDSNGDGAISRSEANANAQLASMYDSLDTGATIEKRARQVNPAGLTRNQFETGRQAVWSARLCPAAPRATATT